MNDIYNMVSVFEKSLQDTRKNISTTLKNNTSFVHTLISGIDVLLNSTDDVFTEVMLSKPAVDGKQYPLIFYYIILAEYTYIADLSYKEREQAKEKLIDLIKKIYKNTELLKHIHSGVRSLDLILRSSETAVIDSRKWNNSFINSIIPILFDPKHPSYFYSIINAEYTYKYLSTTPALFYLYYIGASNNIFNKFNEYIELAKPFYNNKYIYDYMCNPINISAGIKLYEEDDFAFKFPFYSIVYNPRIALAIAVKENYNCSPILNIYGAMLYNILITKKLDERWLPTLIFPPQDLKLLLKENHLVIKNLRYMLISYKLFDLLHTNNNPLLIKAYPIWNAPSTPYKTLKTMLNYICTWKEVK